MFSSCFAAAFLRRPCNEAAPVAFCRVSTYRLPCVLARCREAGLNAVLKLCRTPSLETSLRRRSDAY